MAIDWEWIRTLSEKYGGVYAWGMEDVRAQTLRDIRKLQPTSHSVAPVEAFSFVLLRDARQPSESNRQRSHR